jgi:hypothetical protein
MPDRRVTCGGVDTLPTAKSTVRHCNLFSLMLLSYSTAFCSVYSDYRTDDGTANDIADEMIVHPDERPTQ